MEQKVFDHILKQRCEKMVEVLGTKGAEYARIDRLSHFKWTGELMQCSPEKACAFFMAKHYISILSLINDLDRNKQAPISLWDEKIGDAINYLVLLEALVKERLWIVK